MLKKIVAIAGLSIATLTGAAHAYGVPAANLVAVVNVESGGNGYLPDGRIKILFEGHILWRRLQLRGIDPKPLALACPTVCFPSWTTRWYQGGAFEYARVQKVLDWASKHDPQRFESYKKAALEACSWGAFQVMGFRYDQCGFPNVYEMKHALEQSPAAQLNAALQYIRANGLLAPLAQGNWVAFARGYNGIGNVPVYAARLAAAKAAAARLGL